MSSYSGYLLKFGSNILPNNYILSYSATPLQRTESSAYRDANNNLHRTTLPNHKSKIELSTHIMTLDEKITFQSYINLAMVNTAQRKVTVTYWNDETNSYSTGSFYIPDITYTVRDADTNTIMYDPITVTLVEY